jgi:hypothetical protein
VPKPLKVVIWIVVFAAFAGAGAFVASRSDPFPPGVEDPGARPTTSIPSPTPTSEVWALTMHSATRHRLHVGGSCRSDWQIDGLVTVQPNGTAAGDATARLTRPASCDFPQAQVQTRRIQLVVTGELKGTVLRLAFREAGRSPTGSQDLGGFSNTLREIVPVFHLEADVQRGRATVQATKADGDLGIYGSDSRCDISLQ